MDPLERIPLFNATLYDSDDVEDCSTPQARRFQMAGECPLEEAKVTDVADVVFSSLSQELNNGGTRIVPNPSISGEDNPRDVGPQASGDASLAPILPALAPLLPLMEGKGGSELNHREKVPSPPLPSPPPAPRHPEHRSSRSEITVKTDSSENLDRPITETTVTGLDFMVSGRRWPKAPESFSLDDLDIFSQTSFRELITQRTAAGLPYVLAFLYDDDPCDKPLIMDGTSFLRSFYRHGNVLNPLTRKTLKSFQLFKISSLAGPFRFLCDNTSLRENGDHYAKMINAWDPELSPAKRGCERYYLAYFYGQKAARIGNPVEAMGHYAKELNWLEKAAADRFIPAYMRLAELYLTGNALVAVSDCQALAYLRRAAHEVRDEGERAREILRACLEVFIDFQENCSEDVGYILSRLGRLNGSDVTKDLGSKEPDGKNPKV